MSAEQSAVEVTQADRDAAANLAEQLGSAIHLGGNDLAAIREGFWDNSDATDILGKLVQAFARHRLANRTCTGGGELVERIGARGMALLWLMSNEQCLDAEDPVLHPFCDDRGEETDTINLCFEAGLLEQTGSEDVFLVRITDAGRSALTASPPSEQDRSTSEGENL